MIAPQGIVIADAVMMRTSLDATRATMLPT